MLSAPRQKSPVNSEALPLILLGAGFFARLAWSAWGFLNPDEAAHYLLSMQPSLALAYKASLTTAHPPLLILFLHYWQAIGISEIALRLPSVIAGTVFCWMVFRWMERVANRTSALVTLALLLFSPSLISLSAEIRQYSLLMAFAACSLYLLERAVGEESPAMMAGSFVALYLAMLSHYSSLIFALALGVYGLFRLYSVRSKVFLIAVWVTGQIGGIALAATLYVTHVSKLEDRNLPQQIADTWLRNSIFHRGEENVLAFIAKANIRVFHFDFGNNVIGVLGLMLFVVGIVILLRDKSGAPDHAKPSPRLLGMFLLLPFVINCAVAVAGLYPYGGTRHNALLTGFAMCGTGVGVSAWRTSVRWAKPLGIALVLLICNVFPSPSGAYIQPRNQNRHLMVQAAEFVRQSVPAGSVLFTDYQSGLLFSYYLCHDKVVQFDPPFQPFLKSDCGNVKVISTFPRIWIFQPDSFPGALQDLQKTYALNSDAKLWVFQAGWLVNDEPVMQKQFRRYGCTRPQSFGENILLCELRAQ